MNRAHQLANQGLLGIELLLGYGVLCPEVFVTLAIQLRVSKERLVPVQLPLRLQDLNLKGPGVDLCQDLTCFHKLAFGPPDGFEFAIDFGPNHGRVQSREGPDCRNTCGDVHLSDQAHRHGLWAPPAKTETPPSKAWAPGTTCSGSRGWPAGWRLFGGGRQGGAQEPGFDAGVPPRQTHHQGHQDHPENGV